METLTYIDQVTHGRGYLVYDARECRIAAGGCRVQPGLTADTLGELAARMTLKQRVLGLNVDGAKCGLDHDPRAADANAVIRRFLDFLRSELTTRLSMGCDMGTRFDGLERLAREIGIPSIKYAVRAAQGLTDDDFLQRMRVLDARVGRRTVAERRAGHALAHATLAAAARCGHRIHGLRAALQGFGNLGRSAAESLHEHGVRVVAIADRFGCVVDAAGLDVTRLLEIDYSQPVHSTVAAGARRASQDLFGLDVDVLVLAGGVNDLSDEQIAAISVPVVVVGANCGLTQRSEYRLEESGVTVIPDFIGGCGGSASMEALFGPPRTPTPDGVLEDIGALMDELVTDLINGASSRGVTVSQVARDIAAAALVSSAERPYGASPYAMRGRAPRGHRGRIGTTVESPAAAQTEGELA